MKKLLLSIGILSFSFCSFAQLMSLFESKSDMQNINRIIEASVKIQQLYVDSVSSDEMAENAIKGILEKLDPHSVYIPKDEVKKANEQLVGNFEGIGVQFQILDDTLFVEQTISGGPSEKVGILPGDRIVTVNDSTIAGVKLTNLDVMKKLRGKKGTSVNVKVLRRGNPDLLSFKIIRDKIPLFSVDASYMATPSIGYIKLNRFSATSKDEFDKAFDELKAQGMKDLIFDLQSNGGGYLKTAIDLADEFLADKKMIVYTKGRSENNDQTKFIASSKGKFETGRIVVLVDEYSASASEIISGAIQDWDRGLIIGRRTYGKGLVQQQIPMSDGAMMRLTTARYYTPAGRCIQKPYKEGIEKYKHDLIDRYNRGELSSADSIHFPDSLKRYTLNLHRPVYGGGGIMPDIFIPIDTTHLTKYLKKIVSKGIVNSFSSKYFETHADEWKVKYPTYKIFSEQFTVSDEILNELTDAATKDEVEFVKDDFEKSKAFLSMELKALFARRLWGLSEFYQEINTTNDTYKKAIEVLEKENEYKLSLTQN